MFSHHFASGANSGPQNLGATDVDAKTEHFASEDF
jgi:hypothetical protein